MGDQGRRHRALPRLLEGPGVAVLAPQAVRAAVDPALHHLQPADHLPDERQVPRGARRGPLPAHVPAKGDLPLRQHHGVA
eukprot:15052581-Alexandrium_andersonii.AAC.1